MTSTIQYRTAIYFIAIVPPEPLYSEIQEIKEEVGRTYKTKEALRRPPHATLIPPFNAPTSVEPDLVTFMETYGNSQKPFDIFIDGFGEFHQGTIFIKPNESPELMKMQKELAKAFNKVYSRGKSRGPSYGFHPHITIAYKDLTRPMFDAAWREYHDKIFRRRFTLDHIDLMRWDNGWKTIKEGIFTNGTSIDELSLFD